MSDVSDPSDAASEWRGHTVLQVPVPALEEFVRSRTAHYDAGFVSSDPMFVHAHVTALGPFAADPTPSDLENVARIAGETRVFDAVLTEVVAFPDGIIHLRPEPDGGFRDLTRRLADAFPEHPPYAGRHGPPEAVVPHLTLDLISPAVSVESTRQSLGRTVPVTIRAERLDLVWYESGACRLLASWSFSQPFSQAFS